MVENSILTFRLGMYVSEDLTELRKGLEGIPLPDGVIVKMHTLGEGDVRLKACGYCMVISTDAGQLRGVSPEGKGRIFRVYVGKYKDIADIPDADNIINDVWPDDAPDYAMLRARRLILGIYDSFRAFTYERLLYTIIDASPSMIWFKDMNGKHMIVNNTFCETVQKPREDVTGKGHCYIWNVPPGSERVCEDSENEVIAAGETRSFEEPVKTSKGMRQFTTFKAPIYDEFGGVRGTAGIGQDVTGFENMGIEFSILLENIPFPLIICDTNWNLVRMNQTFRRFFDIDTQKQVSFVYKEWKKEAMSPISPEMTNEARGLFTQEFTYVNEAGQTHVFIVHEQDVHDYFDNITGYFCIFRDITKEREFEKQIIETANTDALTGLYNRRYFYDYIGRNKDSYMTLVYLDLDHFKEVNDRYGHDRGDDVLIKSARLIETEFKNGITARLGGDEFAVILRDTINEKTVKERIADLEEKIPTIFRATDFSIGISAGYAVKDSGDVDIETFVQRADQAMYEIKKKHHGEVKNTRGK